MRRLFLASCAVLFAISATAQQAEPSSAPAVAPAPVEQPSSSVPASPVYKVGGGVAPPSVVSTVDPELSEKVRLAKQQAVVILWLIVDEQGMPQNIKVARTAGMGLDELDEKAIEAVKQWRFQPARKAGKPVAVQINVQVNFRLDDKPAYSDLMQRIVDRISLPDETAIQELERSAQAGSVQNQLTMGCLLTLGPSVHIKSPKTLKYNPVWARKYFEKAARAGSTEAQFLLAMNSASGPNPSDYVAAASWLNIAAASGFKPARKEVKQIEKKLTPDQLAEAHRRADEWIKSHPKS